MHVWGGRGDLNSEKFKLKLDLELTQRVLSVELKTKQKPVILNSSFA